ncbi:MAG: hypothetical protein QXX95_08370 [Nitrososphaerales archaeon]
MDMSLAEKKKQEVYIVEECLNCGLKSKRLFKEGDYVFKRVSKCIKCNFDVIISAIYAETQKIS